MLKMIAKFKKANDLKYISHLDTIRLFQRALRRAEIPVKFSEGYNPHPIISFAYPLSVGIESMGEYLEVELTDEINEVNFISRLNSKLPEDSAIIKAAYSKDEDSLMALSEWSEYLINIEIENDIEENELEKIAKDIIENGRTIIRKKKKKNKIVEKEINTKELIKYLNIKKIGDKRILIETIIKTSSTGSLKINEFIEILSNNQIKINNYGTIRNNILNKNFKPLV